MQHDHLMTLPAAAPRAGKRFYRICKRLIDLVLATILVILISPLLLLIAIAIWRDSPGPVLFRQIRLGRGGRPFMFYKFRSMYHNADPELHLRYVQSFIQNQAPVSRSAEARAAPFKLNADPRITPLGRVLRRTSLDELPQLFNVIKGDMSLVGPRPPVPYEVQEYQEWHKERLAALPGITGWWQVRGRSLVPFDEMVRMDIDYIARQSLWLDFTILLLTIPTVILGRGAR